MATATSVSERIAELHERAVIVNGLGNVLRHPTRRELRFELPGMMRSGGVTAVNLTVAVIDHAQQGIASLRLARAATSR